MFVDYNDASQPDPRGRCRVTKLAKTRVLTQQQMEAARMVAEGHERRKDIAATVGVQEVTLYKWMRIPEFQDLVDEYVKLAARATRARVLHDSQQVATALTEEILRRIDAKQLSDVNWKTLLKESGEWLTRYLDESGVGAKKAGVSLTQINIGNDMTLRDIMDRRQQRPADDVIEVIEVEAEILPEEGEDDAETRLP